MPQPSALDELTIEDRAALEKEVSRRNFKDLDGITSWLHDKGYNISRSAVGRINLKLKKRLQQVKDATDACKLIAEESPDDAGARNAAVISLVQTEMFNAMMSLQELNNESEPIAPAERICLLKEASVSILNISKTSISQKKYEQEFRQKVREEALAEISEVLESSEQLDKKTLASIRAEILEKVLGNPVKKG